MHACVPAPSSAQRGLRCSRPGLSLGSPRLRGAKPHDGKGRSLSAHPRSLPARLPGGEATSGGNHTSPSQSRGRLCREGVSTVFSVRKRLSDVSGKCWVGQVTTQCHAGQCPPPAGLGAGRLAFRVCQCLWCKYSGHS